MRKLLFFVGIVLITFPSCVQNKLEVLCLKDGQEYKEMIDLDFISADGEINTYFRFIYR